MSAAAAALQQASTARAAPACARAHTSSRPAPALARFTGAPAAAPAMAAAATAAAAAPRRAVAAAAASPRRHATGAPVRHGALVAAPGTRVAVVVARFNDLVTRPLLEGCLHSLEAHGVDCEKNVDVAWVPGAFELPLAAKALARSGAFDAVVAIGAVVRGATTHYEAVAGGAASGLMSAGMDTGVPVVFGVLTCETMEQALDRAGGKVGNKGGEAAATAVEMANLLAGLRADGKAAAAWV